VERHPPVSPGARKSLQLRLHGANTICSTRAADVPIVVAVMIVPDRGVSLEEALDPPARGGSRMQCMASISKRIPLDADVATVWTAVRDVGNAHHVFAPVLTDCKLEGDDLRVVTFANGMVLHERIVDVDEAARRVAYTVVDGPFTHHHATFTVAAEPDGTSVLAWVSDVLPDDVAPMVADLMDQGALAAQRALGRQAMLES
jgi:Polyketide cyclase / dehydrase and lipid transport